MFVQSRWSYILARKRRQLPLDVEHSSPIAIRQIVLDMRTPGQILDRIARCWCDDEHIVRDLVRCPNLSETTLAFIALSTSDEIRAFIAGTRFMDVVMDDGAEAPAHGQPATGRPQKGAKQKLNLTQQVQRMTAPQKIQLAMRGAKEARGLLIRESNKQIALAVLENPRLTDGEVEAFAKSANMSEDVIRSIGSNPEWAKRYPIVQALVNNPKTPPAVAMPFVNRMQDRDLAMLEKNKNVSEAVRSAARGLMVKRKKTQGGGGH
jgi:hypothetical protein